MRALLATLIAGTAVAHAQAPASSCQVTIVRAPDAVKATVEQWLAQEHCTNALTVRIIPTENNGLYVLATDPNGKVRERIVPDAQSAGVLIASWAADDGLGGATPPPGVTSPAAPVSAAPVASAGASAYGGEFHPPGETDPEDDYPVSKPAVYPKNFITLEGGFGPNDAQGLHAEVDVFARNNSTLGLFAGGWGNQMSVTDYTYNPYGAQYQANVADYVFGINGGHTWRMADWHLRGAIGLGVMISQMNIFNADGLGNWYGGQGTAASPYGELELMVGHTVGEAKHWAIEGGLVAGYTRQNWQIDSTTNGMETLERDAGSALIVAGLRYGL
ncbi:MAG: hypothetical protein QM831_09410 [Kofleriaceae bacterium]